AQEGDEEARPLHLDEEEEPEQYADSAAEQEARPLFLSEPRRPREPERPAERRDSERREPERRDAVDSAFHGARQAAYPAPRPAAISLLPERTDRYAGAASVAATM